MSRYAEDRLPPFAQVVLAASQAMDEAGAGDSIEPAWTIEKLRVETPWEIDIASTDEALAIGAAPPTQIVQTSVMPVWHRIGLTVRINDGRRGD